MQLYCRQCGAQIQSDGINLEKMMAKCDTCNAVFSFADMYDEIEPKSAKRKQDLYAGVPMPDNITLYETDSALVIQRRWFEWTHLAMLGFGIFWIIIVGGMMSDTGSMRGLPEDNIPSLLMLLFVGVGAFMVATAIVGLVNTTTIQVDDNEICITHHPVPIPGNNKRLDVASIEQLYTKQIVHRNQKKNHYSYTLSAIDRDQKERKLITQLTKPEQALYLEQEIERFLGIVDQPVRGEYGKTGFYA